jgi:hypothetical protein
MYFYVYMYNVYLQHVPVYCRYGANFEANNLERGVE